VGTGSLIWRTLRTFLRCYDNPHGKDEMEQRLYNWKWSKTVSETMPNFNEVVHIWNQSAHQTTTLHFARQVDMPTPHAILDQIVKKMPPWAKKHMQEHPGKYTSVPQLWVSLKEEEAVRLTRTTTSNIATNCNLTGLLRICPFLIGPTPHQRSHLSTSLHQQ
jgi:hypothetical protein